MRSPIGTLLNRAPIKYVGSGSLVSSLAPPPSSEQMMRQYGSVGTLFTIVQRIANSLSEVEWHLYRKHTDQRRRYGPVEDSRVEVTSHWALDVWNQPNPFMTRQEFVEVFSQHVELVGEGWWVVGRNSRSSLPLTLWPVRPDKMEPVPHPTQYLSGYIYHGPNGEEVPLGLDEVVFLRSPNPLDAYRGLGPVQSILTDLDATRYSAEWNRNFFFNDASPGGIIEVDKRLDDDEFKEMTMRWREQHQGVRNAHRVAVIEQGKWVDRSFSMRDLQFGELRHVGRDIIREAFGYPKPMLGSVEDINRANAEAGEVVFARWVLRQRLKRIKGALNSDFLPLFGKDVGREYEFDHDDPTPEDREADRLERVSAVEMAVKLIKEGFDAAQVLEFLGLPQMDWTKPAAPKPAAPKPAPAALGSYDPADFGQIDLAQVMRALALVRQNGQKETADAT
jgi:HK97 family phage portal protein